MHESPKAKYRYSTRLLQVAGVLRRILMTSAHSNNDRITCYADEQKKPHYFVLIVDYCANNLSKGWDNMQISRVR